MVFNSLAGLIGFPWLLLQGIKEGEQSTFMFFILRITKKISLGNICRAQGMLIFNLANGIIDCLQPPLCRLEIGRCLFYRDYRSAHVWFFGP